MVWRNVDDGANMPRYVRFRIPVANTSWTFDETIVCMLYMYFIMIIGIIWVRGPLNERRETWTHAFHVTVWQKRGVIVGRTQHCQWNVTYYILCFTDVATEILVYVPLLGVFVVAGVNQTNVNRSDPMNGCVQCRNFHPSNSIGWYRIRYGVCSIVISPPV